jgi:hypothetical protein
VLVFRTSLPSCIAGGVMGSHRGTAEAIEYVERRRDLANATMRMQAGEGSTASTSTAAKSARPGSLDSELCDRLWTSVRAGLPIEGVQACAQSLGFFQDGELGYCGRSNASGEFTVKILGTGQYRLEFNTEGHVNYVEEQLPEPPGSIPLTAGE